MIRYETNPWVDPALIQGGGGGGGVYTYVAIAGLDCIEGHHSGLGVDCTDGPWKWRDGCCGNTRGPRRALYDAPSGQRLICHKIVVSTGVYSSTSLESGRYSTLESHSSL